MTTYKELKEISLSFRRLSSSLLNSTDKDASILIQRFKTYIDTTPFIADLIKRTVNGVEYNYSKCFIERSQSGWSEIKPPVDEACHIKAMYDYLGVMSEKNDVLSIALHHDYSEKDFVDIIRHFLDDAFKPLINYIIDSISKEMIILEEEKSPVFIQNIGNIYGSFNQQRNGTINSEANLSFTYPAQVEQILEIIEKLIPSLTEISNIPENTKEDVKDDLQSVEEQLKSQTPKKNRLKKALAGIKNFVKEFSEKIAIDVAVSAVTNTDWTTLIGKIEEYIAQL